jgi:hypothetical protein
MGEIDRFAFCQRATVAGFDPQTGSIGNVFSTDIDGPVTAAALNAPKQTQCDQILRRNPAAPAIAVGRGPAAVCHLFRC